MVDTPPDLQSIRALARGAALNQRLEEVESTLQQLREAIDRMPEQVRAELQTLATHLEKLLEQHRAQLVRRAQPRQRLGQVIALAVAFGGGAALQSCPGRLQPRRAPAPPVDPGSDKDAVPHQAQGNPRHNPECTGLHGPNEPEICQDRYRLIIPMPNDLRGMDRLPPQNHSPR